MTPSQEGRDRISEYERAVCYCTLPRVTSPVTVGLIAAYFVCVAEAVAALCYGLAWQRPVWTRVGVVATAAVTVLGVAMFMGLALRNEVNRRKALAAARHVPETLAVMPDLPDPFAEHRLMRRPLHARGRAFECTDNDGQALYAVEILQHGEWLRVTNPAGEELLRVRGAGTGRSFSIDRGVPGKITVHVGEEEVARVFRRFSFTVPSIIISCTRPVPREYAVQHDGIYSDKQLAGRIYSLRDYLYLDIRKDAFHEGVLGFFIAMC